MFVEHEEKLVFDQITENICPNAPHPGLLILPQVPDLKAPGGRGEEGEGIFELRKATDGAGNGQFPETLTTHQTPEGEKSRRDGLAGSH